MPETETEKKKKEQTAGAQAEALENAEAGTLAGARGEAMAKAGSTGAAARRYREGEARIQRATRERLQKVEVKDAPYYLSSNYEPMGGLGGASRLNQILREERAADPAASEEQLADRAAKRAGLRRKPPRPTAAP